MSDGKESIKPKRKRKRKSPTRLVTLNAETKQKLLDAAKKRAAEVAAQPTDESRAKVPGLIAGMAKRLRKEDAKLSEAAITAGIMGALEAGILEGHFIAPAPATIARYVKIALANDPRGADPAAS